MKISSPFYIEKRSGKGHIDLCGSWDFTYVPERTDKISELDFKYSATIPAATYWNIYECGLLPHPYEGTNSHLYRDLDRSIWYYRKKFTPERTVNPEDENAYLCFDGIGYYSRVWLNGELLGEHEGMFGGPVIDVASILKDGENELIVELCAFNYGLSEKERYYGINGNWFAETSAIVPWNVSRDSESSNGDFITFGIWREVRLEILPKKHISRPYLYTKELCEDSAVLGLELNVATGEINELLVQLADLESWNYSFSYRQGLSGILSGESVDISVKILDGDREIFNETEPFSLYDYKKSGIALDMWDLQIYRRDIRLSDITPWYPHGLGEAKLYNVEISLIYKGFPLDTLTFKTGIRKIQQDYSAGRKYRQRWDKYHFSVNGKKMFLKGMNWMPTDFLYDESPDDTRWALEMLKNQGVQLVRVWSGGGKPESDLFYDICDELGIMVWQDAMLANHTSRLWNGQVLENQVCFYLYRLRNHPSLAVHCGGNEQRAYHIENNAAQYIIQRNVEDLDFSRKYYRVTPDKGSMHTYNDMEPVWFRKRYADLPFMAECGIHCFPNSKSLRQLISQKEYSSPLDNLMDESFRKNFPELLNHFTEYQPQRIPRMLSRASHIEDIRGISLERICEATQMASYEFYLFLTQSLREAYPHCTGLMPWVFKRTWTTTAIQMVDGLFEPCATYYAVKSGYENVSVIASLCEVDYAPLERMEIPVKVINDSDAPISGKVTLQIFSPDLSLASEKTVNVTCTDYLTEVMTEYFDIPSDYSEKYFFLRVKLDCNDLTRSCFYPIACLERLSDKAQRAEWRENIHENLFFDNGPHQRPQIENSKSSVITAELLQNNRVGNRIISKVKISVKNSPAYPIKLIVREDKTSSFASDSFFFMNVGEEKTVDIQTRNLGNPSRPLSLEISAWNAAPVVLEI